MTGGKGPLSQASSQHSRGWRHGVFNSQGQKLGPGSAPTPLPAPCPSTSTARGNGHEAIFMGPSPRSLLGKSCCCCAASVGEENLLRRKAEEEEGVERGGLRTVAQLLEMEGKT